MASNKISVLFSFPEREKNTDFDHFTMKNSKQIFDTAKNLADCNGILRRADGNAVTLRCTLLPSPFPSHFFKLAESIQEDLNLIYHKVAMDHEFLESLMKHVVDKDDYIQHLWSIYSRAKTQAKTQRLWLGLNRSDYMLHQNPLLESEAKQVEVNQRLRRTDSAASWLSSVGDSPAKDQSADQWPGFSLLQVEFNLMASSFCGFAQRIAEQHKQTLALCGFDSKMFDRVPDCPSADNFVDAMATARQLYFRSTQSEVDEKLGPAPPSQKCAVLMIVGIHETNVYDQTALFARMLLRHPDVPVRVQSFEDLTQTTGRLRLDEQLRLFIDDEEIAVVYFRHGYVPDHYSNEEIWDVKYQLERSMAIKCPCVQYMLANTKLVQAALSKPDTLARFISPQTPAYSRILATFAKQYTLSDDFGLSDEAEIQDILAKCRKHPSAYVLKPQREGGGNNYFDAELIEMLQSVMEKKEQHAYIVMERLFPFVVENYVVSSESSDSHEMVSELGIFGAFIGRGAEVLLNQHSGHLLRTKLLTSNEGGIAAGYGCLDSPFLV